MIKVVLAEDMHMVRGALIALLNLEPDIEVVAEAAVGTDILPTVQKHQPDVAVIDIDLPLLDGLSAVKLLQEHTPRVRTLIVTSLGRPATLRRALSAKVGGLLLKDAPAKELADAIRSVNAGKRVVDNQLALAALDSAECPLTPRELEVLALAADGAEAVEIATRLFLSAGTVRNYLTTIATKLNARSRVDAVRIARDTGWL
ncbi:response regulator transcription factor [Amycolatopsis minnesotensis]|uniref:Response regulator transcription factor n=1 Tax=Amycolatopsis minnesotensis TaxID=337894 RepID=A0ABN2S1C6_9PSEU